MPDQCHSHSCFHLAVVKLSKWLKKKSEIFNGAAAAVAITTINNKSNNEIPNTSNAILIMNYSCCVFLHTNENFVFCFFFFFALNQSFQYQLRPIPCTRVLRSRDQVYDENLVPYYTTPCICTGTHTHKHTWTECGKLIFVVCRKLDWKSSCPLLNLYIIF